MPQESLLPGVATITAAQAGDREWTRPEDMTSISFLNAVRTEAHRMGHREVVFVGTISTGAPNEVRLPKPRTRTRRVREVA